MSTTEAFSPPVNLIQDFQSLHTMILEDQKGDRTRELVEYFKKSEAQSLEMQLHAEEFEQKQFAQMLHEAFGAAARIASSAWEKAHKTPLPV
jgi:hypothetical protein